jgi:penicillin G amidase
MRLVGKILIGLLVFVLVIGVGFAGWFTWMVRRSYPQASGTIDVAGLSAPVTVVRDANGIPNIYADTTEDLFFAQGYVHAQDRFWQMHFNRRVTAGRLAELVGEPGLDTDKYLRTMGWRRLAEQEWAAARGESRTVLQAYADGVNAYIADRSPTQLGLEFLLLRVLGGSRDVEPWTPVDTLAWAKAVAWDLRGNAEDEVNRVRYAEAVGGPRATELYPGFPYDEYPVIVPQGAVVDGAFDVDAAVDPSASGSGCTGSGCPDPAAESRIEAAEEALLGLGGGSSARLGMSPLARETADALESVDPSLRGLASIEATLETLIGPVGDGVGSNSWAVGPAHTATGSALLVNDPHLGPAMPSLWYQIGMHCRTVSDACAYDFAGLSFPGVPAILSGHNQQAGWGVTNLGPDVTDLVLEQIDDSGYFVDGEHKPFTVIEDVIKVAGADDVAITIRATEHGPLMSDVGSTEQDIAATAPVPPGSPDPGDGYGVSYRWTALQPGRLFDAVIGLVKMSSWEEFRAAAQDWNVPAQNLVYADVEGNIGYQAPGQIPVRTGYSGKYPVPGWDSKYDWDGFIEFDALPNMLNPDSGLVITANNAAIGEQYPYLLTDDWDYGQRANRITELLAQATAGGAKVDAAAMSRIQLDTYNTNAATLVPRLQQVVSGLDDRTAAAVALFEGWDFHDDADSAASAYFNAFWRNLQEPLFNDELPANARSSGGGRWWVVVDELWARPDDAWWDDTSTPERESRDATVVAALTAAARELTDRFGSDTAEWSWGQMHTLTVVANPFGASGVGVIERMFNRGPVELGGGKGIVDAVGWDASITCDPALDETDSDKVDSDDASCADPAIEPAYHVNWIPSFRSVVDFADYDRSTWVHLTGASGHAFNAHYDDQLELWATGQTLPWAFTQAAVDAAAEDTLTLNPAA